MPVRETSICILAMNVDKGTRFHVRGKNACKKVYSSNHPHVELMKLVYVNSMWILKFFPTYFHLLANSWYCPQLKSLVFVCHLSKSMGQSPIWEANRSSAIQEIPQIFGTQNFINPFKSIRHLSLTWVRPIQSMTPHATSWTSVLVLYSHLRLGLPRCFFFQISPPIFVHTSSFSHTCHMSNPSNSIFNP